MSLATDLLDDTLSTWGEFLLLTVPSATILVAFFIVVGIGTKFFRVPIPQFGWAFVLAFCMVGIVPGIVAGYSQQAIAGTFLTATVGIISAMLSYAFAKDSLSDWRPVIPVLIIATLFGALVGFGAGGISKQRWLIYDQNVAQAKVDFEVVVAPLEAKRRQENFTRLAAQTEGYISAAELHRANAYPPPEGVPVPLPEPEVR